MSLNICDILGCDKNARYIVNNEDICTYHKIKYELKRLLKRIEKSVESYK